MKRTELQISNFKQILPIKFPIRIIIVTIQLLRNTQHILVFFFIFEIEISVFLKIEYLLIEIINLAINRNDI